jgi:hypothetical protein
MALFMDGGSAFGRARTGVLCEQHAGIIHLKDERVLPSGVLVNAARRGGAALVQRGTSN